MEKIQIITIILNFLFLIYVGRLIMKGKLREEYAISWLVITVFLIIFSFWRNGLNVLAKMFGVIDPPNLVFTGFIFLILIYLLHLSVVNSKLQKNLNKLAQEIALMKEQSEKEKQHETNPG